ncbi:hypothetical protein HN512_00970 [Candidatus Peregrinibacteria bacterium]|nr:hypothetical protein [Candidatus Peregrinibacteria bacterium]MBT3598390.1 hypothetical protein [Candidatus Peregrinibacteria bacterium]MBT4367427.1 hypothetical protein [Candidatus Peregrinibacteria bacterium]MBT4585661.1 hypothetical protein [Candidatus Peregrinibacteria bacterium]MBT6730427.1 hypothetical protein [Candidatus Peregrinibacteria bacterium]
MNFCPKKLELYIFTMLLACVFFVPSSVKAATYYWVGSAGGSTNSASNWATSDPSSCTGGGAGVPGSSDTAIFDADCDNSASIDSALSVQSLTINTGYSGTITQETGITIAVARDFTQNDGTFVGGDSTIDINYDLRINGGSFTATSGTITIALDLDIDASATFVHGSGTIHIDGVSASTLSLWK